MDHSYHKINIVIKIKNKNIVKCRCHVFYAYLSWFFTHKNHTEEQVNIKLICKCVNVHNNCFLSVCDLALKFLFFILITILILWYEELNIAFRKNFYFWIWIIFFKVLIAFFIQIMVIELHYNSWSQWFSWGTVSSTNETDHHDITEICFESGVKHHNPLTFSWNRSELFFSYMYIIVPTLMYKEGKLLYQADWWNPLPCLGGREMLIFMVEQQMVAFVNKNTNARNLSKIICSVILHF
jgi:energy-coupling factor transporter transmembrane protein EcfT